MLTADSLIKGVDMLHKGRVWKFGDNIDTDIIIPARYLALTDPKALGEHCMEPLAPSFHKEVKPGDIIVGGLNFGCGSSREQAASTLKGWRSWKPMSLTTLVKAMR